MLLVGAKYTDCASSNSESGNFTYKETAEVENNKTQDCMKNTQMVSNISNMLSIKLYTYNQQYGMIYIFQTQAAFDLAYTTKWKRKKKKI